MRPPPKPPRYRPPARPLRRLRRAALPFALVLGVHLALVWWWSQHPLRIRLPEPVAVPVQIALLKTAPVAPSAPPAKPPTPPTPSKAAPPRRTRPAIAPAVRVAPAPPAPADPNAASGPDTASAPAAETASAASAAAAPGAPGAVKFALPPSGDLLYNTYYNGVRNAPGTIRWRTDGSRYDLSVSMPVPFIGPFVYASHGHLDVFGIAPEQYSETRGSHPPDIAIFNRDTRQIFFTRTPNTLPLPDGTVDRFSLLIELAGLVRGDPNAYKPGVAHDFFVVDRDSGENWPIMTIGDETIDTDSGPMAARHFMRLPRRAGDTRRIDIWLAPALGWLPARMVQHEPNGTLIELVWHGPASLADEPGGAGSASAAPATTSPDGGSPAAPIPPAPAAAGEAPAPIPGASTGAPLR